MESPQKRSLGRLALAVLSTNVAVLAMNFLTGIIISRTLGVDGRGRLSTLQLWPMLISTTLSGGFNAAAIHFTAKNLGERPRYVGGIVVLSLVIGLITMAIGVPMALYELPLRKDDLNILLLAFFTIPIGVIAELTSAAVNGMGRLDVGNRTRLIRVVCTLVVLAVLFLTRQINLATVFWAVWAPSWVAILLNLKVLRDADLLHWGDARGTLKLWFPYAMAGFVSSMLQVIYFRCDQLLMTIYMSDGQRGLYANAVMFSELLLQVPNAISTVVFTNTSLQGESNEDKLRSCSRLVRMGVAAVGVCGILGMLFLPLMLRIVYGKDFVGAGRLFNFLLPGSLALSIAAPLQVFYQGKNRPWTILGPQLVSIVVTATGMFFALRAKDLTWIAITASAGYITYTLGLLWHIRRDYGTRAIGSLFPNPGMIRSGWNRVREIVRRRLSFVG